MPFWIDMGTALLIVPLLAGAAEATELRLLTHPLAPFTIVGPTEAGAPAPTGLAVDIVRRLLQRTGDAGSLTVEPFPRLLQDVQNGPMTLGFIVARTPPREALLQWVGPIIVNPVYLYQRANAAFRPATLDEARRLDAIGVVRGDADHIRMQTQGFTNLQISDSQALNIKKLQLGRLDATPIGEVVFASVVRAAGLDPAGFVRSEVKLYDSFVYLAFSPDVPKAGVDSWAAALESLKASAEYPALLDRYGIERRPPTGQGGD